MRNEEMKWGNEVEKSNAEMKEGSGNELGWEVRGKKGEVRDKNEECDYISVKIRLHFCRDFVFVNY